MQFHGGFEVEIEVEEEQEEDSENDNEKEDQKSPKDQDQPEIILPELGSDRKDKSPDQPKPTSKPPPEWMKSVLQQQKETVIDEILNFKAGEDPHKHHEQEDSESDVKPNFRNPGDVDKVLDLAEQENKDQDQETKPTTQTPNWQKVIAQRKLDMQNSREKSHNEHESMSGYTKIMEELGFDEKEIHEKLKTGSFDKVKKEIDFKTKQLDEFLNDFSKIMNAYSDNKELLDVHVNELFDKIINQNNEKNNEMKFEDKVNIEKLIDEYDIRSVNDLFKMKVKDPKIFRKIVENYHKLDLDTIRPDFSSSSAAAARLASEHEKYIGHIVLNNQDISNKLSETHTYLFGFCVVMVFLFLTIGTKKIGRKFRAYADELMVVQKSPEKQFWLA